VGIADPDGQIRTDTGLARQYQLSEGFGVSGLGSSHKICYQLMFHAGPSRTSSIDILSCHAGVTLGSYSEITCACR
jgi:hypothetical protein